MYSEPAKGVVTHSLCKKKNEYVSKSRMACESYRYDIFKKRVKRKKDTALTGFSPEDFAL